MARIDCYSHYFKVTELDNRARQLIERYLRKKFTKMGKRVVGWRNGRPIFETYPAQVFGLETKDGSEYRLHINTLQDFLDFAKSDAVRHEFSIHQVPLYSPVAVKFKIKEKWQPREKQIPLIEYITTDEIDRQPARQRAAILQAGGGKTLSMFFSMERMGVRSLLTIKGGYVKQWVNVYTDIMENYKKGDVLVIKGTQSLISLMNMAIDGTLEAKFIIITNKTFQMYINDYAHNKHESGIYPIHIDEFYQKLGIGLLVNDEVHMHFHFNFMQDILCHVPLSVGLTATLTPDDPFMDNMYCTMFPKHLRFKGAAFNRYAQAVCIHYKLEQPRFAQYKQRGMGSYSHIVYEEWLLKNKKSLENYLKIIDTIVDFEFAQKHVPGERMLLFAASIGFCTLLHKHYTEKYPQLKVNRYVEDDPFENLLTGDLCISTLLSSGTAVDVPGLIRVLMTTALGSSQLNEQAFGRLREIKTDSGLRFLWLSCDNITQHVKYTEKKKELLKDKATSIESFDINIKV